MSESSRRQNGAGRSLLLVHGSDFKPDADVFLDLSLQAVAAGLERDFPLELDAYNAISKRGCYYGDYVNTLLTRYGKHFDEVLDIGDRRNALAQLKLLTKRKHFGLGRYERLPGKSATTEFVVNIVAPLLALLGFSKPLIARLSKDICEYWYGDGSFAESVRSAVRDQIKSALEKDERILLISHGTGSIVTYDVLWELSHGDEFAERLSQHKVDTWVTLGAPLGDSLVKRRLMGAKEKGRKKYPNNVVSWHNISAEDDYMSHDNTLADDFRPMLKHRLVSSIRDYKVYNLCIRYGKSNPHSSLGYLIHPRMAQIVVEWLKSDPQAPPDRSISE